MSKTTRSFSRPESQGFFDDLPSDIQELVRDALIDTIDECEGWKSSGETIEEIYCRTRDGFIAYSHNHGGLVARQFTDLMGLWGSGRRVAHEKAQAEIERQIEYGLQYARDVFFERYESQLREIGITSKDHDKLNYHDLYDLNLGELAEQLSEYEHENLSDDSGSIMFEARFMYHGESDGMHSASISCAVNTEGPYHRSSIPWAPNVFCEGAKEIEIEWRTKAELKRKLKQALKQTSFERFLIR